ncbi:MAG: hypothetical protein E5V63_16475 [Mesorhizobium sp.]|nr:MAG: hypothetical protein E5V63_16475 [Mesorhizobium sp.]
MAEFFGSDAERLIKEKANRNFWNDAGDDTIEKMRRWLLSEPVLDRLLSASVRPEEQWRIDSALLILDAVTQERHG